jgi:hypothetical protein
MQQKKIKTINDATDMAQSILAGITEVGATIALPHNPSADITFDLNNLITERGNFEQAKQIKATRRQTLKQAMEEVKKNLRVTRDIFKLAWGNSYSDMFTALGFQNDELRVPTKVADQQGMLQAIKAHLTANPTHEVPPLVTATGAQDLFDMLVSASNSLKSQESEIKARMNVRNEKFKTLKKRISNVFAELSVQLTPLDPRWKKFGFEMPGTEVTPETPVNLVAVLIGPTVAAMKWDAAARAGHYRVYKKVIGVDEKPVPVGSAADIDFNLENLPPGSTVEIYVSAVNGAGESPLSAKVTVLTHA